MYIHLGQEKVVKTDEVIGIFDLESTTVSKRTRDFLAAFEKNKRLIYCTDDLPKSFIVYDDGHGLWVYVTQVSTTTLLKRSDFLKNIGMMNSEGEKNV